MNKPDRRKPNGRARPIKTKRDYEGASAVAKRLSQTERDSAAELRLQSLLQEMDRFDEAEDDALEDPSAEFVHSGPRRRWSDDGSGDS